MDEMCDCDRPPEKALCQLRAPLGLVVRENRAPAKCRLFDIEAALSLLRESRDV